MKKGYWEDTINCCRSQFKIKKKFTIALVILSIFSLDLVSKIIVHREFRGSFKPELSLINLAAPFPLDLTLTLTYNKGAAFGLFATHSQILICARIVIISAVIFYVFSRDKNSLRDLFPALLIIGGALGNIVDFFLYGHVVDFIRLGMWQIYLPVFNIADTFITVGSVWFILKKIKDS